MFIEKFIHSAEILITFNQEFSPDPNVLTIIFFSPIAGCFGIEKFEFLFLVYEDKFIWFSVAFSFILVDDVARKGVIGRLRIRQNCD